MHIFHSRENIKTCIFTAVKIQDLIFSRERNRKIGTTFFYFLNMVLGKQLFMAYLFLFYGKQLLVLKSESLRSLTKERAFINLSTTTRKSKQKLM